MQKQLKNVKYCLLFQSLDTTGDNISLLSTIVKSELIFTCVYNDRSHIENDDDTI